MRPGRIDYRLYMGSATEEQRIELYRRFFPFVSIAEAQMFVESNRHAETMAEFQGLLLAMEDRGRLRQSRLEFKEQSREVLVG